MINLVSIPNRVHGHVLGREDSHVMRRVLELGDKSGVYSKQSAWSCLREGVCHVMRRVLELGDKSGVYSKQSTW